MDGLPMAIFIINQKAKKRQKSFSEGFQRRVYEFNFESNVNLRLT
jgi:hypothetical protein